jgi:formamidopyrimidine-DNA glycosylase
MPELPEVETTRRGIEPLVAGRRFVGVEIYDRRLRWPVPGDLAARLAGRRVDLLGRRGKYLLFRLGDDTLLVHLGMTGSLRAHTGPPPARRTHDHVDLRLEDGVTLRYHDPRRFGALLWLPRPVEAHPLLATLGPEPLGSAFDPMRLHAATRGRRAPIKAVLMDNRVVVGVGNIYANEALHRAGIRPTLAAGRVSRPRLVRLVECVRATLEEAIAAGGSTLRDYVDSSGEPGYFQIRHLVYGREGEACRSCGSLIRMRRIAGRASFYCPACQR